jgi:hypothetical protein
MTALGPRGARLMASLEARDPSLKAADNPLREVAIRTCVAADRVDRLEGLAAEVEPWVATEKGVLITHPVLVEVRQQVNLLARLVASLRLPDQKTGKRPQGRPLRGVHRPAAVSSLERARQRAEER